MRGLHHLILGAGLALIVLPVSAGAGAPTCTIDFDSVCPNTMRVCGAAFNGGLGCVFENNGFCYDTGAFSYKLEPGDRARVFLQKEVDELTVYFVHFGSGQPGKMRFFDANGLQVGEVLSTNEDCSAAMGALQTVTFTSPAAQVQFKANDIPVYVDSMELTPNP